MAAGPLDTWRRPHCSKTGEDFCYYWNEWGHKKTAEKTESVSERSTQHSALCRITNSDPDWVQLELTGFSLTGLWEQRPQFHSVSSNTLLIWGVLLTHHAAWRTSTFAHRAGVRSLSRWLWWRRLFHLPAQRTCLHRFVLLQRTKLHVGAWSIKHNMIVMGCFWIPVLRYFFYFPVLNCLPLRLGINYNVLVSASQLQSFSFCFSRGCSSGKTEHLQICRRQDWDTFLFLSHFPPAAL